MGAIDARLAELGLEIPDAPAPAANYVPYAVSGSLVFCAGQIPLVKGEITHKGQIGAEADIEHGYAAARVCGVNLLAQVKAACGGDLDRVVRVVRLGGFVNAAPDFTNHPKVINGASDLMVEVFGDAGKHARAAVGCSSLPLGVSAEVDGIFEIR
ncbi:MAG: RidA family protein [Rhodospirillales bacterium]